MRTLSIDIETFSSVDLRKCGLYKYVESPDFEVLMIALAFDDQLVSCCDLTKSGNEEFLADLLLHLLDPFVKKTAYNAAFEIAGLSKLLGVQLPPAQWECTMVLGAQAGWPFGLDKISKAMGLPESKDKQGSALIRYFTMPCKPPKKDPTKLRNLPQYAPERWDKFIDYCIQDVVVERTLRNKLAWLPIDKREHELWQLDQAINSAGVTVDKRLIRNAISMADRNTQELTTEAIEISGLDNPNSVAQLKRWFSEAIEGDDITSLTKDSIPDLLKRTDDAVTTRMLNIRAELAKTSVKKYIKMFDSTCLDGTLKGLFQFCGANRTWRWAGRGTQVQNLPKNKHKQLDLLRQWVSENNFDALQMVFGNIPDILSQLIRTTFVPMPGNRQLVADYSSIEARIIAWLAGEQWRLDVFRTHGKIYEASGATMFKVSIESITKTSDIRAKAKIAELALGYGGSVGALIKMNDQMAEADRLDPDEFPGIVSIWRTANVKIVNMWKRINSLALRAVETHRTTIYKIPLTDASIIFSISHDTFFIELPGGSKLAYPQPRINPNGKFGTELTYMGLNDKGKWTRLSTYGGKLTENITQGIARNCLKEGLFGLSDAAYHIVMHVHDEVVADMPEDCGSVEEMCAIMSKPVSWAPTLPLAAEGFETLFYKKD